MHRFFVSADAIRGARVRLSGPVVHQIQRVLRLRGGQQIIVLDDSGWEYTVELEDRGEEELGGRVVARAEAQTEPRTRVTLYQALLKGERFEWVLQKGTELGIAAFVPLLCERNVVRDPATVHRKSARWRTILREAAEQSRRGRLPRLEPPFAFAAACQRAQAEGGLLLMAWEEETAVSLREVLRKSLAGDQLPSTSAQPAGCDSRPGALSVQLFIGPEGGFTPEEASLAKAHGIQPVTLGRRILRAETAGVATVAALFYETGDWG